MSDRVIVYRDPAALKDYGRNSRSHTAAQIKAIRRSIEEFGFNSPILLKDDDETIGAGHARRAAALLDPPLPRVPTITLTGLSEAQWRAYVIADNKLAEVGSSWNLENLSLELGELKGLNLDLDLIGFDEAARSGIFGPLSLGETDATAAWRGMPEFTQEDKTAFRSILVHFKDQAGVDDFAALLKRTFTDKTKFAWFPHVEIETYADKRYTTAAPGSAVPDLYPVEGATPLPPDGQSAGADGGAVPRRGRKRAVRGLRNGDPGGAASDPAA